MDQARFTFDSGEALKEAKDFMGKAYLASPGGLTQDAMLTLLLTSIFDGDPNAARLKIMKKKNEMFPMRSWRK
jgi:hypothetical protein